MSRANVDSAPLPWTGYTPVRDGATTYRRLASVLHDDAVPGPHARDAVRTLFAEPLDPADPAALQYVIFASALAKRLTGEVPADANLYLRQFERPQISLFNLLARHLPTVSLAGRIANELLCRFVHDLDEFTLFDIGIGSGQQEVALLHKLARRGRLPRRLTVVAVEPSADSLRTAEAALGAAAARLEVELDFRPVQAVAEGLGRTHWAALRDTPGPTVVLSAFAAHHVRPPVSGECARDRLFAELRAHEPLAVVLCEPSADHHTESFADRFDACWRHFGLTFDLINRLDVSEDDKAAMKMFFAREIEDIVANGEESRCERHEPVESWVGRLRRAGFGLYSDMEFARGFADHAVAVSANEGYVGLDHQGETLVAVLCGTTAPTGSVRGHAEREIALGRGELARAR